MTCKSTLLNVLLIIFLSFLYSSIFADVIINIVDVDRKIMRVTYRLSYDEPGSTASIFPSSGYSFASGPIEVIEVIEKNTAQKLVYKIMPAPKANTLQAVKFYFPNPIPKGGNYIVEITVEAQTNNITKDEQGRYVFTYETSHNNAFFILPKGHAIVFCNYPVLVYEREGRTVVQVMKEKGRKELMIKTRAFKMENE